jgi:hypothetical protein
MLPVVDDAVAESDALAFAVGFALADCDGLFVGVDEALAAAGDTWPCVGAELVQLGLAVDWTLLLADLLGLGLGLAPLLALEDVVGVVGAEPPGLALGVALPLGLALALPDALELTLTVLPLLVVPLEDVAGAVVATVVLLGELLLVAVTDECVDGDPQTLREGCRTTAGLLDGTLPVAEGVEEIVLPPWLSVWAGPLEEPPVMADQPALVTCSNPWRAGGTTDKTTPSANTATPTAKAGRSMASRQSLGRRGSRRCGACCSGTRKPRRRISLAAARQMASQTPRIQLGWLACAGRDRILSRIRSRPSEPGST